MKKLKIKTPFTRQTWYIRAIYVNNNNSNCFCEVTTLRVFWIEFVIDIFIWPKIIIIDRKVLNTSNLIWVFPSNAKGIVPKCIFTTKRWLSTGDFEFLAIYLKD